MAHPSSLFSKGEAGIPPLRAGDHLNVEEFERRYWAMPDETKAELIEGVVYVVAPPVNDTYHGCPHANLAGIVGNYRFNTLGVQAGINSTLKGFHGANQPQPDLLLRILPESGGQAWTDEEGFLVGAPELIGEITLSSTSYDLHVKKDVYQNNGVQEYVIWRTEDRELDWFRLRADGYNRLQPDADGILKSEVFPGLWLDAKAMLNEDFSRVLEIQQRGIASPEHQAFGQELQTRREAPKKS